MFTPQDLLELHDQVSYELNQTLADMKVENSKNIEDYDRNLLSIDEVKIHITKDDDVMEKLREVIKTYEATDAIGTKVVMDGSTYASGRYDYFDSVSFSVRFYTIVDKVSDSYIKSIVKDQLIILVKPADWTKDDMYRPFYLECSLLKLFSEGTISIDDVIAKSNEDCDV